MRTARLWKDPRTGIWKLRRRIPEVYRSVTARRGDVVKISTGTADRKAAERALPDVLARWNAMCAEWDRQLHIVALDVGKAREIAAGWAAWIVGSPSRLETGGIAASAFNLLPTAPDSAASYPLVWGRVEHHADEALAIAGISITPETRAILLNTMEPVVASAYAEREARQVGEWLPLDGYPERLAAVQSALPKPPEPVKAMLTPAVSLSGLLDAWKAVCAVKPRTVAETEYAIGALGKFLGHDDAAKITREDFLRWRQAMKAEGLTNSTWNNRLSMARQIFLQAVKDEALKSDPTINLRLAKERQQSPKPYSDEDATRILLAARKETSPALRWSHWIMAFSGMRAGEVLQLLGHDVRAEGGIWFLDVNEDHSTKSVKTSQRRHVPLHPALIAEGFLNYVTTIEADAPLFPEKGLDQHGHRGGRAWNLIGKWIRETIGITDPTKAPDHSWRHRVEDELRSIECPEDVRDAILGHQRKTTGRLYGVRGEALKRLHRYLSRVPVPPGL